MHHHFRWAPQVKSLMTSKCQLKITENRENMSLQPLQPSNPSHFPPIFLPFSPYCSILGGVQCQHLHGLGRQQHGALSEATAHLQDPGARLRVTPGQVPEGSGDGGRMCSGKKWWNTWWNRWNILLKKYRCGYCMVFMIGLEVLNGVDCCFQNCLTCVKFKLGLLILLIMNIGMFAINNSDMTYLVVTGNILSGRFPWKKRWKTAAAALRRCHHLQLDLCWLPWLTGKIFLYQQREPSSHGTGYGYDILRHLG